MNGDSVLLVTLHPCLTAEHIFSTSPIMMDLIIFKFATGEQNSSAKAYFLTVQLPMALCKGDFCNIFKDWEFLFKFTCMLEDLYIGQKSV